MLFGTFPTVGLKAARAKRKHARELLDAGIDPVGQRRREKAAQAASAASALEDVAREWYEHKHRGEGRGQPRRAQPAPARDQRLPEHRPPPRRGDCGPEVLEPLRRIERKSHIETAHRVKTLVSQVLRYAVATGRAERDVTADLRDALKSARPNHHAAVIDPDELGEYRAIDTNSGQPATCAALRLAPLVAVRPGELRRARWADIDLDAARWEVTAKAGHVRSRAAVAPGRRRPARHAAGRLLRVGIPQHARQGPADERRDGQRRPGPARLRRPHDRPRLARRVPHPGRRAPALPRRDRRDAARPPRPGRAWTGVQPDSGSASARGSCRLGETTSTACGTGRRK
ncbi:MAG: hypothetical protein U5K43_01595 [Halofilum sp. (in: g-proteobacteria)]|nr:hypothetical protein [Halofilum sp. (in: g-proteobacteria)]